MNKDLIIINKKIDALTKLISDYLNIEEAQEMVDIHGAASILGKPETAVRQMVHRGQLSCKKLDNKRLYFNTRYLKSFYANHD